MKLTPVVDLRHHPALVDDDECFYLHEILSEESARLTGREPTPTEDSHLGDFIEDKTLVSPSDAVINMNLAEETRRVLATLTPREEEILRTRFGIGEKGDKTLEEVGQDFEVTRRRIREIEAKALRRLRRRPLADELAESLASRSSPFSKNLLDWTLVPVPSWTLGEPATPLEHLLGELHGRIGPALDTRTLFRPTRRAPQPERSPRTVEAFKSAYAVLGRPPRSAGILLIGDVLGDGVPFRACKELLRSAFTDRRVVGIFFAKMPSE